MVKTITTKRVTDSESIIQMLSDANGKRITLITKTIPKLLKGHPFGDIRKVSQVSGQCGCFYGNCIDNEKGRQGLDQDTKPHPRKWGVRIQGMPFVVHTAKTGEVKLYLEMKVDNSMGYSYEDANGNPIDKDEVNKWLPQKDENILHGVKVNWHWRDYSLKNIIGIRFNGKTFVIEGNLTLAQDIAAIRGQNGR